MYKIYTCWYFVNYDDNNIIIVIVVVVDDVIRVYRDARKHVEMRRLWRSSN